MTLTPCVPEQLPLLLIWKRPPLKLRLLRLPLLKRLRPWPQLLFLPEPRPLPSVPALIPPVLPQPAPMAASLSATSAA